MADKFDFQAPPPIAVKAKSGKTRGAPRLAQHEKRTEQFITRLFLKERYFIDCLLRMGSVAKDYPTASSLMIDLIRRFSKEKGLDWSNPDPELVRLLWDDRASISLDEFLAIPYPPK